MSDPIREGIQKLLDLYDDGWTVAHYVVAMGLERICDGQVESASWQYVPPNQPHYVISGLLDDAAAALIERGHPWGSEMGD